MNIELFSVFDAVLRKYNEPFHARSVERAKVMFGLVANNPESDIAKFPSEYTLFHVGSFDLLTGLPKPHKTPLSLGVAAQYQEIERPEVHAPPAMKDLTELAIIAKESETA